MKKDFLTNILNTLDEEYGTTKEGFFYREDWQLLTAIMLSAQSTDNQVYQVLPGLWERFQLIEDIDNAPVEEIKQYIKSIGLYKSKAKNIKLCCNQILVNFKGKVPTTIEDLVQLAGVGRKTATLFLADYYGIPGVTVDTHVLRISKRIGFAKGKNPVTVERELMDVLPIEHWNRINFQMIYHGRKVCQARKCNCEDCVISRWYQKILT